MREKILIHHMTFRISSKLKRLLDRLGWGSDEIRSAVQFVAEWKEEIEKEKKRRKAA